MKSRGELQALTLAAVLAVDRGDVDAAKKAIYELHWEAFDCVRGHDALSKAASDYVASVDALRAAADEAYAQRTKAGR